MRSGQPEVKGPKLEHLQCLNRITENKHFVRREYRRREGETYDEDWRRGVDPREMSKHSQVPEVINSKVPQHPYRC